MIPKVLMNRYLGCLRGLAVGDALGAPVEFKVRDSFTPVVGFRPTAHFNLKAGQYTDDTIMALGLADALIEAKGYDSYAIMNRWLSWVVDGAYSPTGTCFDIGLQTSRAIKRYQENPYMDSDNMVKAAGNAPLMRYAPLAIVSHAGLASADLTKELARYSAIETHHSMAARKYTAIFALILRLILSGESKDSLAAILRQAFNDMKTTLDFSSVPELSRDKIISDGHIKNSFTAAYWSFMTTDSFEAAVLKAVNLGGDADTVGAITGQLAGAFYGDNKIPKVWRDELHATEQFPLLVAALTEVPPVVKRTRFTWDENFSQPS